MPIYKMAMASSAILSVVLSANGAKSQSVPTSASNFAPLCCNGYAIIDVAAYLAAMDSCQDDRDLFDEEAIALRSIIANKTTVPARAE